MEKKSNNKIKNILLCVAAFLHFCIFAFLRFSFSFFYALGGCFKTEFLHFEKKSP